uniref:Uncharacterized protein n=1 Tax=Arundo donax TaxID=35708 RepID=A0A0A8ZDR1_ARUDO
MFCDGAVVGDARASRERWVPQVYTELVGSRRSRTTHAASYSYW